MSFAHLIVQPDAAYLVTDYGVFARDGTVLLLQPKTFPAHADRFAYTGVGDAAIVTNVGCLLAKRRATTSFAPEVFVELVREVYSTLGGDPTAHPTTWFAAGWSPENDCPVGLAFDTRAQDDVQPWVWYPVRSIFHPPMTTEELALTGYAAADLLDPSRFRPERDKAFVDVFRRRSTGWGADGLETGCRVAGKIVATRVTRRGIETALVHEYPDRVGELAGQDRGAM